MICKIRRQAKAETLSPGAFVKRPPVGAEMVCADRRFFG